MRPSPSRRTAWDGDGDGLNLRTGAGIGTGTVPLFSERPVFRVPFTTMLLRASEHEASVHDSDLATGGTHSMSKKNLYIYINVCFYYIYIYISFGLQPNVSILWRATSTDDTLTSVVSQ
jgi:hypothetical protein